MKPLRRAPLTEEDWAVWLRFEDRPGWYGYSGYVESDRRDANLMLWREAAKAGTTSNFTDWATDRRKWFPSHWGIA